MTKKFLLSLLLVFGFIITHGQKSKQSPHNLKLPWIGFIWESDSLAGRHFNKVGMSIPLTVEGIPHDFTAQLDLGAVHTIFYGKPLSPYLEKYPGFLRKLDATWVQGYVGYDSSRIFQHVNLELDGFAINDVPVGLLPDFGDTIPKDSVFTATPKHIGTIAPDLFQGKILVIDYPNERLCILDSLPVAFRKAEFVKFRIRKGRIKIPFSINGVEKDLLFDTGSSLFPIFASKDNARFFADTNAEIVDSIVGNQWKQVFKVYGQRITKGLKFGKRTMKPALVYSLDDKGQKQFEDEEGIIAITGNVYFLDRMVIIDYQTNRMGIL